MIHQKKNMEQRADWYFGYLSISYDEVLIKKDILFCIICEEKITGKISKGKMNYYAIDNRFEDWYCWQKTLTPWYIKKQCTGKMVLMYKNHFSSSSHHFPGLPTVLHIKLHATQCHFVTPEIANALCKILMRNVWINIDYMILFGIRWNS